MTASPLAPARARSHPPMSSWRLEWLRFTRTRRWIALFGVYLVFGMLGPVVARYMEQLMQRVQTEITVIVPPPQPRDGVLNYLSQVGQIGLVVVVVVAAGALTLDAHRGLSTFLRTRTTSMWQLILPRVVVPTGAAIAAYAIGFAAAWYGTTLLLGPLPAGPMMVGLLCESVYLAFVVSVVAVASSVARSTLGTVGISLGVLIAGSIAGSVGVLHDWLPTSLSGAPVALLGVETFATYLPALTISVVTSVALVVVAVRRLRHREV